MSERSEDFANVDANEKTGIVKEFTLFLRYNKKYWLAPIIVVLLLLGLLIVVGGNVAAVSIYTLF